MVGKDPWTAAVAILDSEQSALTMLKGLYCSGYESDCRNKSVCIVDSGDRIKSININWACLIVKYCFKCNYSDLHQETLTDRQMIIRNTGLLLDLVD